jgi:hypothetical protein
MTSATQKRLRPISSVASRYGVSHKTIERRVESGVLPRPVYISGLRYWDEVELDEADRALPRTSPKMRRPPRSDAKAASTDWHDWPSADGSVQ